MVAKMMNQYNINTESQAILRAIIIACKSYPVLQAEKEKIKEKYEDLLTEYKNQQDIILNFKRSFNKICNISY